MNAKWRGLPATERQWEVLRRIERELNWRLPMSITRGEASDLITDRFRTDAFAARAHRKAEAARRRAS